MNMAVELGGADGVGGRGIKIKPSDYIYGPLKIHRGLIVCQTFIVVCFVCWGEVCVCVWEGGGGGGS